MSTRTIESATRPVAAVATTRSGLPSSLRQWLRAKILVGGVIVFVLILVGLFGAVAAPYDPNAQTLGDSLVSPQWLGGKHLLGTDNLGRDILSRLMYGARISLV